MKIYPSIPRRPRGKRLRRLHIFDKLDGNNLRFEWARRQDWTRMGSRRRLVDDDDPSFGPARPLFDQTLAEPIARIATDQGWTALTAYAEYWGASSLGGKHVEGEPMRLTLFDVAVYRRGFVGPQRFVDLFGALDVPRYLGEFDWDDTFVQRVRDNDLPGVSFEGVVGKAGDGQRLVTAKAKTQAWVDAIVQRFGSQEGQRLINS